MDALATGFQGLHLVREVQCPGPRRELLDDSGVGDNGGLHIVALLSGPSFTEIGLHDQPRGLGVDHTLVGILSLSEISTCLQSVRRSQGGQRPQYVSRLYLCYGLLVSDNGGGIVALPIARMAEIKPGVTPCFPGTKLVGDLLQALNRCRRDGIRIRSAAELSFDVPQTGKGILFDATNIYQQAPYADHTGNDTPKNEPNGLQMLSCEAKKAPRERNKFIRSLQVFAGQLRTIVRPLIGSSHLLSSSSLRLPNKWAENGEKHQDDRTAEHHATHQRP